MGLVEWIKSENGVKIISFIWGLGISLLFQAECKKRECLIIESPPISEVQKKTFSPLNNMEVLNELKILISNITSLWKEMVY